MLYSAILEATLYATMYDTPPSDQLFWPMAAAKIVEIISKAPCDHKKLIDLAIRHCLPIYATTPLNTKVASWAIEDGQRVSKPECSSRGMYALLMPHDLLQRECCGGPTIVTQVALDFDDALYVDWSTVKRMRDAEHRVDHIFPAFNQGRWMGQSNMLFFPQQVVVSDTTGLLVPFHTIQEIAELLRIEMLRRASDIGTGETAARLEDQQHEDAPNDEDRQDDKFESPNAPVRGITKSQVLQAFDALVKINLNKALSNGQGLYGSNGARVQRGSKGRRQTYVALWNPVIMAVGLYKQQGVPIHRLKKLFREMEFLWDWTEEWQENNKELI